LHTFKIIFPILLLVSCVFASLLDDANSLYSKGKTIEAIPLYKKAISAGENSAFCYFNLANAYYQIDSVAEAIVYYNAAINEAPRFFRGRLNLAIAYYAVDELGECIAQANRALELEPDNQKAILTLAMAYRRLGAYPQAITCFERLAQIAPQREEAPLNLGLLYRDLDDPQEAIAWFNAYPSSGKNIAAALLYCADAYETMGDHVKARYYCVKSFQKDTTKQWTFYRIVNLDEKTGNNLVAFEEAKQGVERFPRFGDLALLAGSMAFKLQRYGEAKRYYENALASGAPGAVSGLENVRTRMEQK